MGLEEYGGGSGDGIGWDGLWTRLFIGFGSLGMGLIA